MTKDGVIVIHAQRFAPGAQPRRRHHRLLELLRAAAVRPTPRRADKPRWAQRRAGSKAKTPQRHQAKRGSSGFDDEWLSENCGGLTKPAIRLKKSGRPRDRSLVFENGTSVEGSASWIMIFGKRFAFFPRENQFPPSDQVEGILLRMMLVAFAPGLRGSPTAPACP